MQLDVVNATAAALNRPQTCCSPSYSSSWQSQAADLTSQSKGRRARAQRHTWATQNRIDST